MTPKKSDKHIEAENQYRAALAKHGHAPENFRPPTGLFPTEEEMKVMTDAIAIEGVIGGQDVTDSEMSRDMRSAWVTFAKCMQDARMVKNTREENVRREKLVMRGSIHPIDHEIVYARDMKKGKIISVNCGWKGQPYYMIQFQEPDGNYRVPPVKQECVQLYARDFVDYGLKLGEDNG